MNKIYNKKKFKKQLSVKLYLGLVIHNFYKLTENITKKKRQIIDIYVIQNHLGGLTPNNGLFRNTLGFHVLVMKMAEYGQI